MLTKIWKSFLVVLVLAGLAFILISLLIVFHVSVFDSIGGGG
jgi:hypothetical protein